MSENKFKYPRTLHVPWSAGVGSDDKILKDLSHFEGKRVIVTIKMDGENSSLMSDCCYARSVDSNNHPSRNWLKGLWGSVCHNIPENWRVCGENLYATHSIHYVDLPSYFMVFNIWDENNTCLNWEDTLTWCELLDLEHVGVIYDGIFDAEVIKKLHEKLDLTKDEGFVLRIADSFHYDDFSKSVCKWVRKNHINLNAKHWQTSKITPNSLK